MHIQSSYSITYPSHRASSYRFSPLEEGHAQVESGGSCSQRQSAVPGLRTRLTTSSQLQEAPATTPERTPPAIHPSPVNARSCGLTQTFRQSQGSGAGPLDIRVHAGASLCASSPCRVRLHVAARAARRLPRPSGCAVGGHAHVDREGVQGPDPSATACSGESTVVFHVMSSWLSVRDATYFLIAFI